MAEANEKPPARHLTHTVLLVAAVTLEALPARQGLHALASFPATPPPYVPGAHEVHALDPCTEYVPPAQARHSAEPLVE